MDQPSVRAQAKRWQRAQASAPTARGHAGKRPLRLVIDQRTRAGMRGRILANVGQLLARCAQDGPKLGVECLNHTFGVNGLEADVALVRRYVPVPVPVPVPVHVHVHVHVALLRRYVCACMFHIPCTLCQLHHMHVQPTGRTSTSSTRACPDALRVRSADVLLGMHGAGLTNSFFMRPNSVLLEVSPPSFSGRRAFVAHLPTCSRHVSSQSTRPITPRFAWPRLAWPRFALGLYLIYRLTSPHLASPRLTSTHLDLPHLTRPWRCDLTDLRVAGLTFISRTHYCGHMAHHRTSSTLRLPSARLSCAAHVPCSVHMQYAHAVCIMHVLLCM